MKVFLSWSGSESRAVADALYSWLPKVIQAVDPFLSSEIEKGAKWSSEIDAVLEGTRFGIICLTRSNLTAPWILFEAGALSKTPDAFIWTFLVGLSPSDVEPPLSKFQHTVAEKEDIRRLLHTINRQVAKVGERALAESALNEIFDTFWEQLRDAIAKARDSEQQVTGELRSDREILEEILELLRSEQRTPPAKYPDLRVDPRGFSLPVLSRSQLEQYLEYLPESDAMIIQLLYGSAERLPMHIDQVAEILGMSRVRVRQHHNRALARLRDLIREQPHQDEDHGHAAILSDAEGHKDLDAIP